MDVKPRKVNENSCLYQIPEAGSDVLAAGGGDITPAPAVQNIAEHVNSQAATNLYDMTSTSN